MNTAGRVNLARAVRGTRGRFNVSTFSYGLAAAIWLVAALLTAWWLA